jgi:hypothetical protein
MLVVTGIAALVFGLIGLVGQAVSSASFPLAQRLGLQEKDDATDPVFRRLELETARWDLVVLWTLPLTGILMLIDHSLWPYLALIAGGVHVDTAGRESAKWRGLRAEGVRIGRPKEARIFLGFLGVTGAVGLWVILFALRELV